MLRCKHTSHAPSCPALLQALLAFNLPLAAAAAHVAALHRLTSSAQGEDGAAAGSSAPAAAAPAAGGKRGKGSKGVGTGAQWAAKLLDAAHDVLSKFMERRGQVRGVEKEQGGGSACEFLGLAGVDLSSGEPVGIAETDWDASLCQCRPWMLLPYGGPRAHCLWWARWPC